MRERDYHIEEQPDGWRLELLEDGQSVDVQLCELHDEALAIGTVWICDDPED